MADTVQWLSYDFGVYEHGAPWGDVGGVYIFTGLTSENLWVPQYVGQTDSFRNRIPSHEQWNPAVQLGATHVHARVVSRPDVRDEIEQELIQAYHPDLNSQLR